MVTFSSKGAYVWSECLPCGKTSTFMRFLYSVIICIPQPLNFLDLILRISLIGALETRMNEGIVTAPTVQYGANEGSTA